MNRTAYINKLLAEPVSGSERIGRISCIFSPVLPTTTSDNTHYVNKIWLPYRPQAARDTHES